MTGPSQAKLDRDYMAEDDHRTLMRAAEVSTDRRRMAGVKRHQRKQEKAMSLMQRTMLRTGRR